MSAAKQNSVSVFVVLPLVKTRPSATANDEKPVPTFARQRILASPLRAVGDQLVS